MYLLILCLDILLIVERRLLKYPAFVYFSSQFYNFCIIYFSFCCLIHTHLGLLYLLFFFFRFSCPPPCCCLPILVSDFILHHYQCGQKSTLLILIQASDQNGLPGIAMPAQEGQQLEHSLPSLASKFHGVISILSPAPLLLDCGQILNC